MIDIDPDKLAPYARFVWYLNYTLDDKSIQYELPVTKCKPEWFEGISPDPNYEMVPWEYYFCLDYTSPLVDESLMELKNLPQEKMTLELVALKCNVGHCNTTTPFIWNHDIKWTFILSLF